MLQKKQFLRWSIICITFQSNVNTGPPRKSTKYSLSSLDSKTPEMVDSSLIKISLNANRLYHLKTPQNFQNNRVALIPFNTVSLCVQELFPSINGTQPIPHRDANIPSSGFLLSSNIPPCSKNWFNIYFRASRTLFLFNKPRKNL